MRHRISVTAIMMAVLVALPAAAVQMEDGPGYLTDAHGTQGVVRAILETRGDFPQFEKYVRPSFQWLHDNRIERDGGYTWLMSTSAPAGHPSRRERIHINLGAMGLIAQLDPELKDPLYKDLYTGARKGIQTKLHWVKTKSGEGVWVEVWPGQAEPYLGLGHSHGQGALLTTASEIWVNTDDRFAAKFAAGIANMVKEYAIEGTDENGRPTATWHLSDDVEKTWRKTSWRTGWCYGTSGVVHGLMNFYDQFPNHKFHDGTSALDLASAGLNWLITKKIVVGNGWNFQNLRTDGPSDNPGFGSGVGGVGFAFLDGYERHKNSNRALAKVYLDAAKKSATYVFELLDMGWDYHGKMHRVQDGHFENMNLGLCGTVGGTGRLLIKMAETVKETDPKFAERNLAGARTVGEWLKTETVPCNDGIAWKARPKFGGDKTINMAIDYGLTGQVIAVHDLAEGLDDPELMALTGKALEGMTSLAVKEGKGYKWPLFTPAETCQ